MSVDYHPRATKLGMPRKLMSKERNDRESAFLRLTLTAFYGGKPPQLSDFIASCQALVSAHVAEGFTPYEGPQVHATIVGLEARWINGQLLNENSLQRGSTRSMDIQGMLDFLHKTSRLPFQVRIGGFQRAKTYPFDSFGRHPFERSFEIQDTGAVVMIGWPINDSYFTNTLYEFRRQFLRFNVLHKYHTSEASADNDLFFVLGTIDSEATGYLDRIAISESIRSEIAKMEPIILNVERGQLSLVRYTDRRLPLSSSIRFPLEGDDGAADPSELIECEYASTPERENNLPTMS